MHVIDYIIFGVYLLCILAVGLYFYKKNETRDDYYVGNRSIAASHIGISIVATDVGGGFSIGLGGLGFVMGVSGSWLLFSGLVGAWLAAVLIIPKVKKIDAKMGMLTFPDFLRYHYGAKVALAAALISGIGYLGFTSGQILAGAKLAAGTLLSDLPFEVDTMQFSLYIMTTVIVLYTVLGGLKAVIYTDTVQWIILFVGLLFFALPFSVIEAGGFDAIRAALPPEHFSLTNISWTTFINWMVTVIPIWFVGMTLYQRMYATRNEKEAKRAWYLAGILEYPLIAFLGVGLGMMGRVFFPEAQPELALPQLLKYSLPVGISGVVVAAYFSAIMSTADSCLIASSGNFVNDIIEKYFMKDASDKKVIRVSQFVTLIIGVVTLLIAAMFQNVLEIILHAYAFMVAGLFVPTLGAYFWKRSHPTAALWAMSLGGGATLLFIGLQQELPFGLDPSFYGILISLVVFVSLSLILNKHDGTVKV
jgi:solute:Na+ symporter, SSS family